MIRARITMIAAAGVTCLLCAGWTPDDLGLPTPDPALANSHGTSIRPVMN